MKLILSELARIDAASGNEAAARDYIKSKIGGREDNLGSLIVGEGKTAVAAALDEKGFFVSEIGEKVRFCPMGRAEVSDLLNRKIRFLINDFLVGDNGLALVRKHQFVPESFHPM